MKLTNTLAVYVFSLLVTAVICVDLRDKFEKSSLQDRLYVWTLSLNSGLMVLAALTVATDGLPGFAVGLVRIGSNMLLDIGTALLSALWVLYADYQISHSPRRIGRFALTLGIFVAIDAVLSVFSAFTGWLYYFDEFNLYHRGVLFPIHALINIGMILYSILLIIRNRRNIKGSYYNALLFFIVPPFALALLQTLFYGLELIFSGVTISLLVVYFNIQNQTMSIDYLTGAFNRKKLDTNLRDKIRGSQQDSSFSAIMLDLNDFKTVNDSYGHHVGDIILKNTVRLLEGVIRHDDFIARFGGDEFVVVVNSGSTKDLKATVKRIDTALKQYNENAVAPYTISFSMGYAVYDPSFGKSAADFLRYVDDLMYENKKKYKRQFKSG